MLAVTNVKFKGKEKEDKLEVEDSEAIEKKEEIKKMGRNLDIARKDPVKWLALKLSGIEEDYLNLFWEETRYISDTDKDLLSEEPKDNVINQLAKSKFEELEIESAIITEEKEIKFGIKILERGLNK
ncbi:hypothetical protein O181_004421 [Austropuccinia psidii MF-1]|uniref:Uncharacterized protein n=1 Tax=Austropuccinia psidii MF-1 TaxID=1389203 RepID=A0A9Q3BGV4_9BASI|nr:hypothetical protein [Austropuccinia psidii MF-1]